MKLHLVKSILVILMFICLAAALLSTLSSPVFLLSLFNGTVLAVIVGTRKRSPHEEEVDCVWNSFRSSYGAQDYTCYDAVRNSDANVDGDGGCEDINNGECYAAKNEDACCKDDEVSEEGEVEGCKEEEELDGYDKDDDEDGSEGEVGWEDEEDEVLDDNLDERAQEFITKVTRGWRDELIREHQKWIA